MFETGRTVRVAFGLGIVSLVAFVLTVLALIDLFQGGENLALELWIARAGLLVILGFHVLALVALHRSSRAGVAGRSDSGRRPSGVSPSSG